ncbi:hypothetical protein GCM10022275_34700 [Tessaracoccus defluvii]
MATLQIRDIMRWAAVSGQPDAEPGSSGYFFEIRFDEDQDLGTGDPEFVNHVILADSRLGLVTITFDDRGLLRSLDIV